MIKSLRRLLKHSFNLKRWFQYRRVLILAIPTGIVAGLGSVLFYCSLDLAHKVFLDFLAGYRPEGPMGEHSIFPPTATPFNRWALAIVPAIGGLISGWLVYTFAPEAEGHGTDAAVEAYHFKNGMVRARIPIIKTIASAITIGSGGSGGREGPIAQIGAGFGSILAQWLSLTQEERRILMMAGMSAGIGSIFHAPLAGAIFAAEILYRDIDMEYELLVPSAITSVVAYCVFSLFFGFGNLFYTPPNFTFAHAKEILPYTVLAVIVAIGANLHSRLFYFIRDLFLKLPVLPHIKPAIGGLFTGIIGYFIPDAIYTGYGLLQNAFFGKCGLMLLLTVAIAKSFTTAFSIGSGGSGGVFGPSVVIGGALGGAVGMGLHHFFPSFVPVPEAYCIVGMAGFFAAAASTPFSTVIMVSEMTGGYGLLLPAVWVSTLAFLLRGKVGLYEKQITTRFDTPIHHGDFLIGVLGKLTVHEALKRFKKEQPAPVLSNTTLPKLLEYMSRYPHSVFPVMSKKGEFLGVVPAIKVRKTVSQNGLSSSVSAVDLIETRPIVYSWDALSLALKRMAEENVDEVVVLSSRGDEKHFSGILTRSDILKAYENLLSNMSDSKAPII
ncbi:Chloride channel protein [Dissulfuribacter thermophilus]|uniref:Chloride channel protein n=1 Tax=Dissulfuribacter thermophilus TaxID=1156395 RepID=A0A1B9F8K6_9BACT|nr:chloride channel protein [Dissulfuribacter thermophilus]OCC16240.1 Chloride channel protein [Dissulfuribacter thermophilus]